MRLLAIDTAGTTGSLALGELDSSGLLQPAHTLDLPARTFSVRLIPAISTLLQQNRMTLHDVDAFVVVSGPGSFTGMRVSLSAVKGLAEATGKPVIALSRLAVMASMLPRAEQVHAILDAGRGEFYSGIYRDAGSQCVRESLSTYEETSSTLHALLSAASTCVAAEESVSAALSAIVPIQLIHPSAADMFPLALHHWQHKLLADNATLDANYLRRSDVELFARPAAAVR